MNTSFLVSSFIQLKYLYFAIDIISLIIFILIFYTFYILKYKNRIFNKRKAFNLAWEECIMEIVLEEGNTASHVFYIPDKIQILLKNKQAKKILLQELVKLKKSLSGVPADNIQKLYEQLRLDELSRHRLNSKKWHIKVQGIQELAIMNQFADSSNILSLTNNNNAMVRMEAQTAMVRLKKYKGLGFFNTLTYPVTEWHQMNLLQLLSNYPVAPVHGIKNWLQSSNSSVVQFALKLIGEQHAEEFCNEVINCLDDFDINVRLSAILCLSEILSVCAIEALKNHFPNEENKELQLCIINQLQKTETESESQLFNTLQNADTKFASYNTNNYLLKDERSFVGHLSQLKLISPIR